MPFASCGDGQSPSQIASGSMAAVHHGEAFRVTLSLSGCVLTAAASTVAARKLAVAARGLVDNPIAAAMEAGPSAAARCHTV